MENHRNLIRVEKKAVNMKIKLMRDQVDNMLKANYTALSQITNDQAEIMKNSIIKYKKLSQLDESQMAKNEKFKIILDKPKPDNMHDCEEVEISLGQIDEILGEGNQGEDTPQVRLYTFLC